MCVSEDRGNGRSWENIVPYFYPGFMDVQVCVKENHATLSSDKNWFFLSKNSKICKTPKGWTQKPQSEDKWNEYLLRPASSE